MLPPHGAMVTEAMMEPTKKERSSSPALPVVLVTCVGLGREQGLHTLNVSKGDSVEQRRAAVLVRAIHIHSLFD